MSTAVWIVLGILLLMVLGGSSNKGKNVKGSGTRGKAYRIDHPHYFEEDDHECSVCGTRFRGKGMTCPRCGTKFTGTKEDDEEFIEEMVIWDDD